VENSNGVPDYENQYYQTHLKFFKDLTPTSGGLRGKAVEPKKKWGNKQGKNEKVLHGW